MERCPALRVDRREVRAPVQKGLSQLGVMAKDRLMKRSQAVPVLHEEERRLGLQESGHPIDIPGSGGV
jgi:hypothetical protein